MRHVAEEAKICIFLLLLCCVLHGNSIVLKRNVPAISVIQERSWCAKAKHEKQFLHINLGRVRTITGLATRKDDTATEFKLSYKKDNDGLWYLYEEEGLVKIFRAKEKSKGPFSRHWLRHKINAKFVKFHVTRWKQPVCLHVEIYGWENDNMKTEVLKGDSGKSPPTLQEPLMKHKGNEDDLKLAKDTEELPNNYPDEPTPYTDEEESNMGLTITVCFLATGIIAILALIIICKWERHERKIRPDHLRANLRENLRSSLGRKY